MALKQTKTLSGQTAFMCNQGVIVQGEATRDVVFYIRVEKISGGKDRITALVSFNSDEITFTGNYEFAPDMGDQNSIAQTYLHLKTLPEFEGAVDC